MKERELRFLSSLCFLIDSQLEIDTYPFFFSGKEKGWINCVDDGLDG